MLQVVIVESSVMFIDPSLETKNKYQLENIDGKNLAFSQEL
jgi:hypothetical protein